MPMDLFDLSAPPGNEEERSEVSTRNVHGVVEAVLMQAWKVLGMNQERIEKQRIRFVRIPGTRAGEGKYEV